MKIKSGLLKYVEPIKNRDETTIIIRIRLNTILSKTAKLLIA